MIEAAGRGEPQLVTKRGAPVVVVLAAEEYARLQAAGLAPGILDHKGAPEGTLFAARAQGQGAQRWVASREEA